MSRFLAGGLADQTTWVLTPTPVPQRAMQMGWWFDDSEKQRRRVFECIEGSRLLHHLQNKLFRSISDCFYPNHLHATDAALESVSCFELPVVLFTLHLLRCRFPACVRAVPKNTKCRGEECDSRHNKLKDRAHNNAKYIYDISSHGG